MKKEIVWTVINDPVWRPEGPFEVSERTKNGWVKLKNHKAARKGLVFESEKEAINYCISRIEITIRWHENKIHNMQYRLHEIEKASEED